MSHDYESIVVGVPDNTLIAMGTQSVRNLTDWEWKLKDARERLAAAENMVAHYTAERDALYREMDMRDLMPVEPRRQRVSASDLTSPF